MFSATFIIDVGSVLLPWRGGGGCYYYNNNLKCMLILSYIDDSDPDRMIFNLNELFDSVFY